MDTTLLAQVLAVCLEEPDIQRIRSIGESKALAERVVVIARRVESALASLPDSCAQASIGPLMPALIRACLHHDRDGMDLILATFMKACESSAPRQSPVLPGAKDLFLA
jgi:hypothetical protein